VPASPPEPPELPLQRPDLLAGEQLPPPPQQERSRKARAALLASALRLFGARGYEATSIEDISAGAGTAVGAFYQHFRNKRQVLMVLMADLVTQIEVLPPPMAREPRALIEGSVRDGFAADFAYAGAARAWREAASRDEELAMLDSQLREWTFARIAMMLSEVATLPGARPDANVSTLAWLMNLLFWDLMHRPEAESDWVAGGVSGLLYTSLFTDAAEP